MRSRRSAANEPEFPILAECGLYAANIKGDGNCVFNAFSDQIFGHQDGHHEIRRTVCDYVEQHASYFKDFVSVNPGGGTRRNPKRKNVAAYSTPYDRQKPTDEEIDRVFSDHVKLMRQGGTWGDNVEIQAFARAYNCIVKIWSAESAYEISPFAGQGGQKVVHVAYHSWEHYSSVRNIDGPHTGLPDIHLRFLTPEAREAMKKKAPAPSQIEDWQINLVQKSINYLVERPVIKKHLAENDCDIDIVVAKLMQNQSSREQSLSQESSSIERDHDSDDEYIDIPNKRRKSESPVRSEPAPSTAPSTTPPSSVGSSSFDSRPKLTAKSCVKRVKSPTQPRSRSRESAAASESRSSQEQADLRRRRRVVLSDSDEDYKLPSDSAAESTAESVASVPASPKKPVRLRLTMPKPPKLPENAADAQGADRPTGKTSQKQTGPQPKKKNMSARDKKDFRKQAQKAARRERQQQAIAEKSPAKLPIITKYSKSDTETPRYTPKKSSKSDSEIPPYSYMKTIRV